MIPWCGSRPASSTPTTWSRTCSARSMRFDTSPKGRSPAAGRRVGRPPTRLAAKRLAYPPLKGREKKRSELRDRKGGKPGGMRHPGGRVRDGARQQFRHAAVAPIVHVQTVGRKRLLKRD